MSTALTETSTFPASVVVPDPGKKVTAESVKVPFQALANRTTNNKDRIDAPVITSSTIITVGDATTRRLGKHDLAVPGDASTTAMTIPDWPANRRVGRLTCRLVSVEAVEPTDAPHYAQQTWQIICRRNGSGTLAIRAVNIVDDTSDASAIEHDISVSEFSGGVRINVVSSASSSDCNCDLIVDLNDGPSWSTS